MSEDTLAKVMVGLLVDVDKKAHAAGVREGMEAERKRFVGLVKEWWDSPPVRTFDALIAAIEKETK